MVSGGPGSKRSRESTRQSYPPAPSTSFRAPALIEVWGRISPPPAPASGAGLPGCPLSFRPSDTRRPIPAAAGGPALCKHAPPVRPVSPERLRQPLAGFRKAQEPGPQPHGVSGGGRFSGRGGVCQGDPLPGGRKAFLRASPTGRAGGGASSAPDSFALFAQPPLLLGKETGRGFLSRFPRAPRLPRTCPATQGSPALFRRPSARGGNHVARPFSGAPPAGGLVNRKASRHLILIRHLRLAEGSAGLWSRAIKRP